MNLFDVLIGFIFGIQVGCLAMLWAVRRDVARARVADGTGDTP